MNNIDEIQVSNFVSYRGPLGDFSSVQVVDVDKVNKDGRGKSNILYTLLKPFSEGKTFAGYQEHVRGILLERRHLEILGFQFNDKSKVFTGHGLVIIRAAGVEAPNSPNSRVIDYGFRVVPENFPKYYTEEMVKETLAIPYVHFLQNYCVNQQINSINFSQINV